MSYNNLRVPITGVLILGFFLTNIALVHAQIASSGARTAALSEAATALDRNHGILHNPALTAGIIENHIELSGSRSFGLRELQNTALALLVPLGWGVVSSTARTFGFSQFRNTQLGVGVSRRLSGPSLPGGAVGLLLIYDHTSTAGYGSAGTVGGVIGGAVELSSSLLLGLQAANIHRSPDHSTSTLPQQLSVGIAYRPTERVQLLVDLQKHARYPVALRSGLEFQPVSALTLRTGMATMPRLLSAGIGLSTGAVDGGLAFVYHYALGWSPALSLGTRW